MGRARKPKSRVQPPPCQQCQAISARTAQRCRNLAQCRVVIRDNIKDASAALCNVHAAQVERYGWKAVRLAPLVPIIGEFKQLRFQPSVIAVEISPAFGKQLTRIEQEQVRQREQLKEQPSVIAVEMPPAFGKQLTRIEQEQVRQREQLLRAAASLSRLEEKLGREKQPAKPIAIEKKPIAIKKEPSAAEKPIIAPKEPIRPLTKAGDDEIPRRDAVRFLDEILATARVMHAQVGTTKSLAETLCLAHISQEKVTKLVAPLDATLHNLDSLLDRVRQSIVDRSIRSLSLHSTKFHQLTMQYEGVTREVRTALEKQCKSKRFALPILFPFALKLASGAIKCNDAKIPQALRNWYLTGSVADPQVYWRQRRLLCNVSATGTGANELEAFQKQQQLRKGFSVYDVRDQVVAFGKRGSKKDEDGFAFAFGFIGGGEPRKESERLADAERMIRQHLAWLATLSLLIAAYAVSGADTSALAYERLNTNVALGTLVLTVGKERALRYMDERRYNALANLANLAGTYTEYLQQPDGAIGLATLAAYAAKKRFEGRVAPSTLRRIMRMTFSSAVAALTLLSGGALLSQFVWLSTATAPKTPYKNAPVGSDEVPVYENGAIAKKLLVLGNTSDGDLPLPDSSGRIPLPDAQQREFSRLLEFGRSNEEQTRSLARQIGATSRALVVSNVPREPNVKMTIYYPQLSTPGARLYPMTRAQYRRAQLGSAVALVSPASSEINTLFKTTLREMARARPRLAKQLRRKVRVEQRREIEAMRARDVRALEREAGRQQQQLGSDEPLQLGVPVVAELAAGAEISRLAPMPFETPVEAQLHAVNVTSAAGAAGAGIAGLVPLLPQVFSESARAPVVVQFPPEIEAARATFRHAAESEASRGAVQTPLQRAETFESGAAVADATENGMTAIRKYQLAFQSPGTNARRDDPEGSRALLSALEPAKRTVNESAVLFDSVDTPDFDDALDYVQQRPRIYSVNETPSQFIKTLSGATQGGVTGLDIAKLRQRMALLDMGITNTTAIDLHLERSFERYDVLGAAASAMSTDIEMLVQMTNDLGYAMKSEASDIEAVVERELERAGIAMRRGAREAVRKAAEVAEAGAGAGREAARLAAQALRSRAVRSIFIESPAALHGFITGIIERQMQRELAELEHASMLEAAIAKTLTVARDMSVSAASLAAHQISVALEAVTKHEIENIDTSDEFDRLMARELQRTIKIGVDEARRLASSVSVQLERATASGKQLSVAARRQAREFARTVATQLQRYEERVSEFVRDTADKGADQVERIGKRFAQSSAEWARTVLQAAERSAERQMRIEQASQKQVRRWSILVQQQSERALNEFSLITSRAVKVAREAASDAANRIKKRLEADRQLQRAGRKLKRNARTIVDDMNERLAARERDRVREQRAVLFANASLRAQRHALQRRYRGALRRERERVALSTFVVEQQRDVKDIAPLFEEKEGEASSKVSQQSLETSLLINEFEEEMKRAKVEDEMLRRSRQLAKVVSKTIEDDDESIESKVDDVARVAAAWDSEVSTDWYQRLVLANKHAMKIKLCLAGVAEDANAVSKTLGFLFGGYAHGKDRAAVTACARERNVPLDFVDEYINKYAVGIPKIPSIIIGAPKERTEPSGPIKEPEEVLPPIEQQPPMQEEIVFSRTPTHRGM